MLRRTKPLMLALAAVLLLTIISYVHIRDPLLLAKALNYMVDQAVAGPDTARQKLNWLLGQLQLYYKDQSAGPGGAADGKSDSEKVQFLDGDNNTDYIETTEEKSADDAKEKQKVDEEKDGVLGAKDKMGTKGKTGAKGKTGTKGNADVSTEEEGTHFRISKEGASGETTEEETDAHKPSKAKPKVPSKAKAQTPEEKELEGRPKEDTFEGEEAKEADKLFELAEKAEELKGKHLKEPAKVDEDTKAKEAEAEQLAKDAQQAEEKDEHKAAGEAMGKDME